MMPKVVVISSLVLFSSLPAMNPALAAIPYYAANIIETPNERNFFQEDQATKETPMPQLPPFETQRDRKTLEDLRKEQLQTQIELHRLILKYNNSHSDREKKKIVAEVRDLVSTQLTKELAEKKHILAVQRARIDEFESKINEIENNKDVFIDKTVAFFLSPQGLVRIQQLNNSERRHQVKVSFTYN
ncbi:MAG: hypothetical protein LBB93_05365 [Elusimicrobiota bacterium]|jgi:hypothetical protein|nr:hypothetical protein [Elusimicrobiota bacterium]